MAGKGKVIVGLIFAVITVIGLVFVLSNGVRNIEDAEMWVAYEHGVCRFVDGYTADECVEMAGPVQWPAQNGKQLFEKYYGEGKAQWVYGENPRLGLGIAEFLLLQRQQQVYALDNVTVLDYTGNISIIQFPNGTTHNLNVSEYSECVAKSVWRDGIGRYLQDGAEEDEILSDNELGISDAMDKCVNSFGSK